MNFYRNVLKQALKIFWENKYLWFFGLFGFGAVLLTIFNELDYLYDLLVFNVMNVSFQSGGIDSISGSFRSLNRLGFFSFEIFSKIARAFATDPFSFLIIFSLFIILLLLFLFFVWVAVVSQSALVANTAKIAGGKTASFQSGIESGIKAFWKIISVDLVFKAVLIVVLSFGYYLSSVFSGYRILFYIFMTVASIFLVGCFYLWKYAVCFIIIKEKKIGESLKESWDLLRRNWLVSIEMHIVMLAINIVMTFLIVSIFISLSVVFTGLSVRTESFLVYAGSLSVIFILVLAVNAMLYAYHYTAWTSFFLELISGGASSKIIRLFKREKRLAGIDKSRV